MSGLYAIISDIHGNAAAFKAVLAEIKRLGAEKICCLGDIVGYGAAAAECLALARENCDFIIRGNHDEQVCPPRHPDMRPEAVAALEYTARVLPAPDIEWLHNLPDVLAPDDLFVICHGALTYRDDYILSSEAAYINLQLLERRFPGKNIAFFGHTHFPMSLTLRGAKTNFAKGGTVLIDPTRCYLCNPGSVGQPRDQVPMASFILYDAPNFQVQWHRVPYDIAVTQKEMQEAGLPEKSWTRIAIGR